MGYGSFRVALPVYNSKDFRRFVDKATKAKKVLKVTS